MDSKCICDDCIHNEVCGEEGHLEPAMLFCVEKISTEAAGMLNRTSGVRLSDIIPLVESFFTVLLYSGEVNNKDTYDNPQDYRVINIDYDLTEQKLCITLKQI